MAESGDRRRPLYPRPARPRQPVARCGRAGGAASHPGLRPRPGHPRRRVRPLAEPARLPRRVARRPRRVAARARLGARRAARRPGRGARRRSSRTRSSRLATRAHTRSERERRLAARFDLRLARRDDGRRPRRAEDLPRLHALLPRVERRRRCARSRQRRGCAPHGVESEHLPEAPDGRSPEVRAEARAPGRASLERWLGQGLARYGDERGGDDLAAEHTSRLSPYLHFGCVSARECVDPRAQPTPQARRGCGSSAGATSTRSSCSRSRVPRARICTTAGTRAVKPGRRSRRGGRDEPGIRSSMQECGNSRVRDGCTTASV